MGTPLLWLVFNLFVLGAIALDLGVFHRHPHKLTTREALIWTLVWLGLTVAFGFGVVHFAGEQRGVEFFTGYVIEKALSVDNLFLFLVIFRAFAVDENIQHRVLEWGILGALVMRGAMIAAGAGLIERFSWVLYVFGAFLVWAGLHMLFAKKKEMHPEQNKISKFAGKYLRVTREFQGGGFFVRNEGKLFATPLFVVLLIVEITDITLAVDSIPAVFGITRDPFVVYTSNVFAILGLRAMYFLLAGVLGRLRYLTTGLAFVLAFIGTKMIVEPWVHISVEISLAAVAGMLLAALAASLLMAPKPRA
ncbi:MAG: TerC family protein [Candidatus Acidiferrum sp.]